MAKRKRKMLTLRLDGLVEKLVCDLARKRGVTRSEVVRDAVNNALREVEEKREMTAYERLKPYIGKIQSQGGRKGRVTSDDASKQVRALIAKKDRARRPR